jgi:hypothetical protein
LIRIISKEIEAHKIQLQSDFQTKFYQFQTRFSSFHTQQAEAIKNLYSMIAEAEISAEEIDEFTNWLEAFDGNLKNDLVLHNAQTLIDDSQQKLKNLDVFFRGNYIYFDKNLCSEIQKVINLLKTIVKGNVGHIRFRAGLHNSIMGTVFINPDSNEIRRSLNERKLKISDLRNNISPLKEVLETEFRRLINIQITDLHILK